MLLARLQRISGLPKFWRNSLFISGAILTTLSFTGCASKPQYTSTRYAPAPDHYTVRSGDTLSGIATRYGLDYVKVAQMNDIAPPYRIYVSQSLRLKGTANNARTTTQPLNANNAQIQRQPVTTAPAQNTSNTAPVAQIPATTATALKWVRPSQGPVIENFNMAKDIKGIRYGGNAGDPVYAAADGQVVYAADGLPEYGRLVLIKHTGGYISAYAHNSKLLVKSGEPISAGKKIAEMGSTGTNRVMLEFQIRLDGKPTNPVNLLPTN